MKKQMTIVEMARMGGKASAKKRLGGKTKDEISEIMRHVRTGKTSFCEEKKPINGDFVK